MSKTNSKNKPIKEKEDNSQLSFINDIKGLEALFELKLKKEGNLKSVDQEELFKLEMYKDAYANFPIINNLSVYERYLLLLALIPHLDPNLLEKKIRQFIGESKDFPQIGGKQGINFPGFLPTGETVLFLFAGEDLQKRLAIYEFFSENHLFARKHILWLEEVPEGEPLMSGRIFISQEYVDLFITGKVAPPRFSMNFPAQLLETELEWKDLVLRSEATDQLKEIVFWLNHGKEMMKDHKMRKIIKPGFRALFHGPPGTGKTLTATLLGKYIGQPVYRIDLSMIISKFIGETEKNLSNLFSKAENKDWILFFDEADALFGKRTNVRDAHDKYANQEVSYLLQRIELFQGLVILATNFKGNMDTAFIRRFQSIIYFPIPNSEERFSLWVNSLPTSLPICPEINFKVMAQKYELTGSEIINVIQNVYLRVLGSSGKKIESHHIIEGIKIEFQKDGRILR